MKKHRRIPVARSIGGVIFGLSTPERYAHSGNIKRSTLLDDLRPTPNDLVPKPTKPTVRGTRPTSIILDDL